MDTNAALLRFVLLSALFPTNVFCQSGKDVNSLLTYLFTTEGYNKKVRPLTDQSQAVDINVDFFLNSVIAFDEQDESLKISGFLECSWTDEYLTWNSSDHNNISELFIPQDDIWKPDISLRNTFKSFTGLGATYLNAYVSSAGDVRWNPYQVLESTCSIDITYFPFDTQTCELKFTAWSYSSDQVELNKGNKGVQLEEYVENSAWALVGTSTRETNTDEAAVFFALKLKRRPNFYIINAILPVVFLSILNSFTFLLPVSSGERASYAVTVFLSLAVFLTIVANELPKNSQKTSLLSVYLMLMNSLSTFIVILSIAEVRIATRNANTKPVTKGYMTFIKISHFITCKTCKKSVTPAKVSTPKARKRLDLEDNITWTEAVDAIDIVFFWFSLLFTFLCTLILGAVAVNGDK
ncbi:acetylcholine receptor subunit delta-like [Mercenaria mercenaria]|uniref:acetylcholine receptor subunit delta-like n=1 Tax=Mercenaria mercenaria TaxID=6596 RepID=UPI00234E5BD3|nr:acetylcholine receptor subunit delta-like [Mercenaria mercenaria]